MHLYLHVPFCARRCSYCDFAIAVRRVVPGSAYATAVRREWRTRLEEPAWSAAERVDTLYFGGGTPSSLDEADLASVLRAITERIPLAPGAEVTLEANPDDVTPTRAAAWRRLGINRVSLGVQSFSPAVLRWMHRTHGVEQVRPAVKALRAAGVDDVSIDLIFGLPGGLDHDWQTELEAGDALAPDHLSLYGLTVEPRTALAKWVARGATPPVAEARYAEEFLGADQFLRARGYEHYEVSNAARPGRRARHNSAYWLRSPYLGLGPSAHSAWGAHRQWNVREWEAYRVAVGAGAGVVAGSEDLDASSVALEELYLGLRTDRGVPAGRIGAAVEERWRAAGWAERVGDAVRLTAGGWLRLDALVLEAVRSAASSLSPSAERS